MKIELTHHAGHAVLTLSGRLDTSVSATAQNEINSRLAQAGNIDSLTVNAKELEYVSSSGLRILLMLAKRYPSFRMTEVRPDVYEILATTGFTQIMKVEKALRRLSVDGCEIIGRGGVGTVYRIDGDTIIKVFREGSTMDEVRKEVTMSKAAFVLGMPTAISFDIVAVGKQFGLVYELLKADTLSACLKREPHRIDEFARMYATLFRQLHSIEVPTGGQIPSAIEQERASVRHISRYFPQESIDMMLQIVDAIPAANRLLHLDLQSKNAMVQTSLEGEEELMLIDMGEVGYGHPMLDLGHAYSAMVSLVGDYEGIIGVPRELGIELWNRTIDYYFDGEPADVIALRKQQIEVVSRVRNFSWLSLSDSFPEAVVNECRQLFSKRIGDRMEYISEICKTFDNWTL